jgi:hypothetical protein
MRSPLDALVTEKVLRRIAISSNLDAFDLIAEDRLEHNVPLKNVCAKVVPWISDEIDEICDVLMISKRRFLEAAFLEAISKARAIMKDEGFEEGHVEGESHASA